uniref:Protein DETOXIFICATION 27-like n=1 Tax=Fagus sylvatica TaxID=28930 RepID=A0A2N9GK66_FAGSY
MGSITRRDDQDVNEPLLPESTTVVGFKDEENKDLASRVWIESKKLWYIVGPAIFSRVASYTMNVITQAFAGHLGEVELAAISIANTVIVGFNFGLLLGMASALETLCGQAFGAKRYHMLGIYMQRSWIVLFLCCFLLLPFYVFATPLLKLLGQPDDVAESSGVVACWLIPLHFSFAFQFPLQRFLQSQLKTIVIAWVSLAGLLVNVLTSWLFVYVWDFGLVGAALALDISWWVLVFGLYGYTVCGGCPLTWSGFSMEAFSGLWEFLKLSAASGVMLCLENWYYRILILMTGYLQNATLAVDALSICEIT